MLDLGAEHPDLVALTAAMPGPTGLSPFQQRFPDRFFDVGIAEQHAVASAAGLATGGLRPVVALYATFLSRAFDQLLMDVALHRLPATFVLDRAGITGPDGPSHHGMWDLTLLGAVPGMRVAVPRHAAQLRVLLTEALAHTAGPTALRFPKANIRHGGVGAATARALADTGSTVPVRILGLPGGFVPQGTRAELLALAGLDRHGITRAVLQARHSDRPEA